MAISMRMAHRRDGRGVPVDRFGFKLEQRSLVQGRLKRMVLQRLMLVGREVAAVVLRWFRVRILRHSR